MVLSQKTNLTKPNLPKTQIQNLMNDWTWAFHKEYVCDFLIQNETTFQRNIRLKNKKSTTYKTKY